MPLQSKPIPQITWQNIAPPYLEYPYFEHGGQVPFQLDSTQFNLTNAWWLSEAALLAYAEEGFARPCLQHAGFKEVWYLDGGSTQCYVAAALPLAVVAFRGTECGIQQGGKALAQFIADLKTDLDIRFVPYEGHGRIHKGFRDGLDEIWPTLADLIGSLEAQGHAIWITGHSLGAALATLAAQRLTTARGLYTFGSPRVGDADFKNNFHVRAYRLVLNNDVVTHVPPRPYHHVGELRYIDNKGVIHQQMTRWKRWMDEIQGHLEAIADMAHNIDQGPAVMLPEGLKDHCPLLYAVHIWNQLIASKQAATLGPSSARPKP